MYNITKRKILVGFLVLILVSCKRNLNNIENGNQSPMVFIKSNGMTCEIGSTDTLTIGDEHL